jgi:hypothetical protein
MATIPTAYTWSVGELMTAAKMNAYLRDLATFMLNPPVFRLWHNTTQSISDSTSTAMVFNQEYTDPDGGHSTTSNTSRYTAQTAGTWLIMAISPWAANSSGKRELYIQHSNGVQYGSTTATALGSNRLSASVTTLVTMTVGEYCEAFVWQNSGGSLNIDNTFRGGQWFMGIWKFA